MKKPIDDRPVLMKFRRAIQTSWRLVTIIWSHERLLFIASCVTTILPGVIPFINAYIYKLIIDQIVTFVSTDTLHQDNLYLLLSARLVTYFVQDAAFRAQDYISHILWTKMPMVFQQQLLRKISSLDIQYFEDSDFKNLLEKVRDVAGYRPQRLVTDLLYGAESLVRVSIAAIALVYLNPYLMLLVVLVIIPEFIVQTRQSQWAWTIWDWQSPLKKRFWYLNDVLQEARSIKEVKLYKLAPKFMEDVHAIQLKFYKDDRMIARKGFKIDILFRVLSAVVYLGVELYAIMQVLARKITIGDIGFYTTVVGNFQGGLGGFFRNMNGVFESSLYLESMFQVFDTPPIIQENDVPIRIKHEQPPRIEFRKVSFVYPGTRKKILRDFSLTIEPGEKIAFVGENGAGKSTIIKLLARLYDVTDGEILINGENLKNVKRADWYACLGVLFQDFNRYDYTLKENIWYGDIDRKPTKETVASAITDAAASGLLKDFKHGYEQMLGRTFEEGVEPSVGQWQKIALARAFFRDAPILILDEPTASIDAKSEAEIFERVENLSRNKTTIIISHRFSTVRKAETIYVLENGRIIESGNHQELVKKNGQYATLFSLQAKGYQ